MQKQSLFRVSMFLPASLLRLCHVFCLLMLAILYACSTTEHKDLLIVYNKQANLPAFLLQDSSNFYLVEITQDLSSLSEDNLQDYNSLLLYAVSADHLSAAQQRHIERFVSVGGNLLLLDVEMQYHRKWPLLEKVLAEKQSDAPKNIRILPIHEQQEKGYAFGKGKVYVLSENLLKTKENFSAFLSGLNSSHRSIQSSYLPPYPDEKRFALDTLFEGLNEPMEIEILPNRNIIIIERGGAVKYFDNQHRKLKTMAQIQVNRTQSNGLNGLALYPDFRSKPWVFLSYTPLHEPYQYISRFYLAGDSLLLRSEKILMKIPINPEDANHASNALEFDAQGNLYIGFGDYTWQPEGYAPIDERPGQERRDAQRTAGNSMSPLGGILRIHPEEDGTYTIPEGNLFSNGGLPEIFVKGCRNPYRFSIDPQTQYLYFGDVGPDASKDSERGTQGYEEVNLAREAGYYGWPYLVADNIAYPDVDFATEKIGPFFNAAAPLNDSPNNTGVTKLPKAVPALLWYPRSPTRQAPYLGQGGMNIMVGPVYRRQQFPFSKEKLPAYFDGKLFLYDWVRGWVNVATLHEDAQIVQVEPFMDSLRFSHPTDMKLGPDGALYMLDYGTDSYARNLDARVVRISYAEGNRKPIARIEASATAGAIPLSVTFSAKTSTDPEQDALTYEWQIEGKTFTGDELKYVFNHAGEYDVKLIVRDAQQATSEQTLSILAGNAPPEIRFLTSANRSFYWNEDSLVYAVEVTDREDGTLSGGEIAEGEVQLNWTYTPSPLAYETENIHDLKDGQLLVEENGCVACHSVDNRSLGPSYREVAQRYAGQEDMGWLANKILRGGMGNWNMGRAMPAHSFLQEAEARKMVSYILSLQTKPATEKLPIQGVLRFDKHTSQNPGIYTLNMQYRDQGANGITPLKAKKQLTFQPPLLAANTANYWHEATPRVNGIALIRADQAYLAFEKLDLTAVRGVRVNIKSAVKGRVEIRSQTPDGTLLGKHLLSPSQPWQDISIPVEYNPVEEDLLFVFRLTEEDPNNVLPAIHHEVASFYFQKK